MFVTPKSISFNNNKNHSTGPAHLFRYNLTQYNKTNKNRQSSRNSSVIVTARYYLLACGPQHDRVLELGGVAALDVAKGRIRVHNVLVAQVLQCHLVFRRAGTIQPALAKRQRTEIFVYYIQKGLR